WMNPPFISVNESLNWMNPPLNSIDRSTRVGAQHVVPLRLSVPHQLAICCKLNLISDFFLS
ncbi:hypothetical protein, partial [Nostoc sp. CALU 546]